MGVSGGGGERWGGVREEDGKLGRKMMLLWCGVGGKVGSLWRSEEEALSQNRLDRFEGFLKYLCFNSGAEPGNKRLTQHMQTKI